MNQQTDTRPVRTSPAPPAEPATPEPEKTPLLGLSAAQVAGSAAAAATAAALGSRLGVVGTVVGAALISMITAVAGAFYTQSLKRTRAAMARTAVRLPTGSWRVTPQQGSDIEVTGALPLVADQPEGTEDDVVRADAAPGTDDTGTTDPQPPWWRRLGWKGVAVTSLVIFALSAVLVTTVELVTDRSLDGTGRSTITHVFGDDSASGSGQQTETPTPTPSEDSTDEGTGSSTDSASESAEPSESPSASASPDDGESASSTPTPTSSPTSQPSGSASAVPTTR